MYWSLLSYKNVILQNLGGCDGYYVPRKVLTENHMSVIRLEDNIFLNSW